MCIFPSISRSYTASFQNQGKICSERGVLCVSVIDRYEKVGSESAESAESAELHFSHAHCHSRPVTEGICGNCTSQAPAGRSRCRNNKCWSRPFGPNTQDCTSTDDASSERMYALKYGASIITTRSFSRERESAHLIHEGESDICNGRRNYFHLSF